MSQSGCFVFVLSAVVFLCPNALHQLMWKSNKIIKTLVSFSSIWHIWRWTCSSIKQQMTAVAASTLDDTLLCIYSDNVKSLYSHLGFMCISSCLSLTPGQARPIKLTFMDMSSSILSPPLWGRTERTWTYSIVLLQPLVLPHSRLLKWINCKPLLLWKNTVLQLSSRTLKQGV